MKNSCCINSVLAFATYILLGACNQETEPFISNTSDTTMQAKACFTIEIDDVIVGDTVCFLNCSENTNAYVWNFGDGYYSNNIEPTHIYLENGTYQVSLIASTNTFSDTVSTVIHVLSKPNNFFIYQNTSYSLTKAQILVGKFNDYNQFRILLGDSLTIFENDSVFSKKNGFCLIVDEPIGLQTYILNKESYALINSEKLQLLNATITINNYNDSLDLCLISDKITLMYANSYTQDKMANYPTYELMEQYINELFHNSSQSFTNYERLLAELSTNKYICVSIKEMIDTYDDSKVVVGLRHDIDNHPFKALKMAKLEREYNVSSSYYILATSVYYGYFTDTNVVRYTCMNDVYKEIYQLGHEIGIHNDLLTVMIAHGLDPFLFNQNELNFYKSLGIPIYGSVGHGSIIASQTVHNSQIFSDYAESDFVIFNGVQYPIGQHSMAEYGFKYEANFIDMNMYFSDSGASWNIDGGFEALLEKIKDSKPGDRIQILAHPCWWR